jgi:hypothetical protein
MKPKTRLLIRFTLPNGDMKGWGYDYPHYNLLSVLKAAIKDDFAEWPEHSEIHLFYWTHEGIITADNADDLAEKAAYWLSTTGDYNGY